MSEAIAETETEDILQPAADLDDLFADDGEIVEPEIDPDLTDDDLRKRLAASERKAEFERKQRIEASKKSWTEEAKEHFPYSRPDSIQADSRRKFLEAAKVQDQDFRERAKELLEKADKSKEEIRAEVEAEVKAEVEAAWGKPFVGSGSAPASDEQVEQRLNESRKRRDLKGAVTALMDGRRI